MKQTSVTKYQSSLCNIPEERKSYLQLGEAWNNELHLQFSFCRPGIYVGTWKIRGFASQGRGDGWILRIVCFVENYTGKDDCQCCYARMYVVLSKAEKHLPYGELVSATECVTL